jgi:hypothetical protein
MPTKTQRVPEHLCVNIGILNPVPLVDWLKGREEHEIAAYWLSLGSYVQLNLLDNTAMLADPTYVPRQAGKKLTKEQIGIRGDADYNVETRPLNRSEVNKLDRFLGKCGKEFIWLENQTK